jgi:putative flippase GtrA
MIAFKYTLFAVVSTLLNLLFQYLSLVVYDGYGSLFLAMCSGTGAGLICKYVLDKKFIFYHKPESKTQDAKKFLSYTLTGGFTTFIFWGTEIWFDWFFDHEAAKYVGAVIGLSIGYVTKYFLDKKYVFKEQPV